MKSRGVQMYGPGFFFKVLSRGYLMVLRCMAFFLNIAGLAKLLLQAALNPIMEISYLSILKKIEL